MGRISIKKAIFTSALALGAIYPGARCIYNRIVKPDPAIQQISPPRQNEVLLSFFANDVSDGRHLACIERAIGQSIDLSVRYLSIPEPFPMAEVNIIKERGGAPFVKIKITPADFSSLGGEKYEEHLERHNEGFKRFGHRIMVGFDLKEVAHYRNLRQVFDQVHSMLDAENITWVWDPAFGKPPAEYKLKWISMDIFQRYTENGYQSFEDLLQLKLKQAQVDGLSIILTVGSNADEETQAQFFEDAIKAAVAKKEIGAINVHGVPAKENWRLSSVSLEKIRAALHKNRSAFVSDVSGKPGKGPATYPPSWETTENNFSSHPARWTLGIYPDLNAITKRSQKCEDILDSNYDRSDLEREIEIRETIRELRQKLSELRGSSRETSKRQNLAQQYADLSYLLNDAGQRVRLLEEALAILKKPIRKAKDEKESGKPDRFPTVFGYFDLRIQIALRIAEIGGKTNLIKAEEECKDILEKLENNETLEEEQVSSYTVKGNESRVFVALGLINERLAEYEEGRYSKALDWYKKADEWAVEEQYRVYISYPGIIDLRINRFSYPDFRFDARMDEFSHILFWRGESRTKLRHTATLARLGRARILLKGKQPPEPVTVIGMLKQLFEWEELTIAEKGRGYMDQGLQAWILKMYACMLTYPSDLQKAKDLFIKIIPWEKIDASEDFKTALKLDNYTLTDPRLRPKRLWEITLDALSKVKTIRGDRELMGMINEIKIYTEIQTEKIR